MMVAPVPNPVQLYEWAPVAVAVIVSPAHRVDDDNVILTAGIACTKTVAVPALLQPRLLTPVTEYMEVKEGFRFTVEVKAPVLQEYDCAPEMSSVVASPAHRLVSPETTSTGRE